MRMPNFCLVGRLSLDATWAGTYRWPSGFSRGAEHKPVWDRFIPTSGTDLCSLLWFSLQGGLDFSNWCSSLPSLLHWLSRKPSAFHLTSPKLAHDNMTPRLPHKVTVGQRRLPVFPSSDHWQMGKILTFHSQTYLLFTVFLIRSYKKAASLGCYQGCFNKENCI